MQGSAAEQREPEDEQEQAMKHLLGQLPVELHDFALSAYLAHLHGNSHVLVALEDQMACNAFAKVAAQVSLRRLGVPAFLTPNSHRY